MVSISALGKVRTRKPNTRGKEKQKVLEPVSSTSRRGARATYHDEYPRDFAPQIAFYVNSTSDT